MIAQEAVLALNIGDRWVYECQTFRSYLSPDEKATGPSWRREYKVIGDTTIGEMTFRKIEIYDGKSGRTSYEFWRADAT